MFGICIALLVFTALSLYLATPESGTYEIHVINVVLAVSFLVPLTYTIRKCRSGDF